MGYESRVDIVLVHRNNVAYDHDRKYAQLLATLDIANGGEFYKVFDKKYADADFEYYPFHDGDHCIQSDATDMYGDKITYADFEKVLNFLEEERQKSIENAEEPYRRFEMLQNLLSTFRTDSWKEKIYVVHWGY